MLYNRKLAIKIAEYLLQIKAIKLQPYKPFVWVSGWKAPIYCDNRRTLSYPKIRSFLRDHFIKVINDKYGKPDVIAGVATGGIAIGALVAEAMNLPFCYVRAEAKVHGLANLVEGVVGVGQKVVIIEDLISTGKSSLKAVSSLRNAGCIVKGMISIFTYNFTIASTAFKKEKCPVFNLCDYETLTKEALKKNVITQKDIALLKSWREAPDKWGQGN
ncbi:MAG: orotate phosphoribosyltransferase [Bacteroidota bacterium]